jgi:hypothetical protein
MVVCNYRLARNWVCGKGSDGETKGGRESLNCSELVHELDSFLRKFVESIVALDDFLYHAKRLEFIQMFQKAVMGQIGTIQYAGGFCTILFVLDDPHNVNVDLHL